MSQKLFYVKLSEDASAPKKATSLSAGYDLSSAYDVVVPKRGSCLVKTDLQFALPSGTYGRLAGRSSLAIRHGIFIAGGVIDGDYRGNITAILFNHSDQDFTIAKGDRVVQLIIEKICNCDLVKVAYLEKTDRDAAGFGSSGMKKFKVEKDD